MTLSIYGQGGTEICRPSLQGDFATYVEQEVSVTPNGSTKNSEAESDTTQQPALSTVFLFCMNQLGV